MKFRHSLDVGDPKVKGQGHQVKKCDMKPHLTGFQAILKVKGHMGQGQKSHWSKVTRVKVSLKVKVTGKKKVIFRFIWQAGNVGDQRSHESR